MAQLVSQAVTKPNIDYHLDYQYGRWESIPEYAAWWPEMNVAEREVFHLEWVGITESRLRDLQEWVDQGHLSDAQLSRFREIMVLVAQHRPTIERLLAS